ncbi:MAG: ferrous iron transport protein B, partial [Promethearchaeota archaeon]
KKDDSKKVNKQEDNREKTSKKNHSIKKKLLIALAGNPNVGKSVIFNQLTGLSQIVGNWPGKTIAKAEGRCRFQDYEFNIIDLPGIYSLSTYSLEEIVSREFIVNEKPDYIINVIDVNFLERNLYFTLQLLMLERPVIIALNQYDILQERGYDVDIKRLEELLGVAVVPTVAVHNRGVHELLEKIIDIEEGRIKLKRKPVTFGKEIERQLDEIVKKIEANYDCTCPPRFTALKLLEKDDYVIKDFENVKKEKMACKDDVIKQIVDNACAELEELHGEKITIIINAELYNIASQISSQVLKIKKPTKKIKWHNIVDHLTIHSFFGYIILAVVLLGSYYLVFRFGDLISSIFDYLMEAWTPWAVQNLNGPDSILYKVVWDGLVGGLMAGIGGVLPYVLPFYVIIEILQDIGYLPRAAYLMDKFMHIMGVHGKTIVPVLLGFGCNVPAIAATRIMETDRERKRAILISSLVPCSATSTIVLGLVGHYLGIGYAFLLYLINFVIIIILGKISSKLDGKEDTELIIELHDFRTPNFKIIMKQSWRSSKDFIYRALPLIVVLGILIQILMEFNMLAFLNNMMAPITVGILGLPAGVTVYLIYGMLRKELNLVLLQIYVVSLGMTMSQYMTPIQMFVFTMVTMLYVPCLATIIMIKKEAGWKFATQITLLEISVSLIIGASLNWGYKLIIWLLAR